jgi:hypothetical protein
MHQLEEVYVFVSDTDDIFIGGIDGIDPRVRSMTSLTPLQPNRIIWVISIASSRRSLLLLALHIVSPISCVGLVILPRSTALRRATRTLMPSTVSSALTLMTCRLVRTKNNLKDTSGHKHSRIGSGYLQCIPASTDTEVSWWASLSATIVSPSRIYRDL